jgi:hypothetical protein
MDGRFDSMDGRFDSLNGRFDSIDRGLNRLSTVIKLLRFAVEVGPDE